MPVHTNVTTAHRFINLDDHGGYNAVRADTIVQVRVDCWDPKSRDGRSEVVLFTDTGAKHIAYVADLAATAHAVAKALATEIASGTEPVASVSDIARACIRQGS